MNIEQLYYTRLSEGWGIAAETQGVNKDIKTAFESINAQNPSDKELLTLDFSADAQGFFLSKSIPVSADRFGRDNYFVHGYYFPQGEKREVFTSFDRLLSLDEFNSSEGDSINIISSLPERGFDCSEAEVVNLVNLIEAMYEAVLGKTTIDIVVTGSANKIDTLRRIMFVTYKYMPLSLRDKISFASDRGGLLRTVTVTGEVDSRSKFKYEYSTGNITGVSWKYKDTVEKVVFDTEFSLEIIQEYITNGFANDTVDVAMYEKAFAYLAMQKEKTGNIKGDEILSTLTDLLYEKKYNNKSDADYMALLIQMIVNQKISIPGTINSMILNVYAQTNNITLKDSIAAYMAYCFEKTCSEADYLRFLKTYEEDERLYQNIMVTAVTSGYQEFTRHTSRSIISGVVDSEYILKNCGSDCAELLGKDIAEYIYISKDGAELVHKVVGNCLEEYIINALILLRPTSEMIWAYVERVYTSKDCCAIFDRIKPENAQYIFNIVINECGQKEERTIALMKNMWYSDSQRYAYVEKKLSEYAKYDVLDRFYTDVMLLEVASIDSMKKVQQQLKTMCPNTKYFDKVAPAKYVSIAKRECISAEATVRAIGHTHDFICSIGQNPMEYVEQLKEFYWDGFTADQWDVNTNYLNLLVPGKKYSDVVELMHEALEILRGNEYVNNNTVIDVIRMLTNKSSVLSADVRDKFIRKLRNEFLRDSEWQQDGLHVRGGNQSYRSYGQGKNTMDMNLFLMLHYSNATESIDPGMKIRDVQAMTRYIESCKGKEKEHFLNREKVIVELYRILFDGSKRARRERRYDYKEAMNQLVDYVKHLKGKKKRRVMKEINKISRVWDFSWVNFLSVLFTLVYCFHLVGISDLGRLLSLIIRGVILVVGILMSAIDAFLDDSSEKGIGNVLISIVTNICLFATLVAVISILL